jgi:ABC-type Na+ efflux pump permease subunit
MVLLPVVERELRVASRGRATYRVRFWAVLVMLALFVWFLKTSGLDPNNSRFGTEAMTVLLIPAFVFSLFIGVIATADCVSSEKRDGTLGLLFLTDLKGYDVICGKLAANSLNAIYGLIAILPVMALPVMLGGVTMGQFAKLALDLLSTMILSLSVGICVSAHSRNERKAMFFTVLILLAATLLPILLPAWYDSVTNSLPETKAWGYLLFSPGYGIIQTMVSPSRFSEFSYWLSILWQWLLAGWLITRASAHVPHSWEESVVKKAPRIQRLRTSARVTSRSLKGRAWLERNPFFWLALQDEEASPRNVWLFVLAILAIWLIGVLKYGMGLMADREMAPIWTYLLHIPLMIWIAAEASRRFSEDRSNNTFEALLSTPLSARQIIHGQWLALLRQFAGPLALVLVWELFIVIYSSNEHTQWFYTPPVFWPKMLLLVADSAALAWTGMWLGLKCKGRIRAILGSLILVLFVPWVTTLGLTTLVISSIGSGWNSGWDYDAWRRRQVLAQLVPSLLIDLLIIGLAASRLPQNFRQLAIRR